MKTACKFFLLTCLSGTALTLPAAAQDIPPGVLAMLDNLEKQTGVKPTYASIEADGDSATITGLTVALPGGGGSPPMTYVTDTLEMSDIEDHGDGLFEIGSAAFRNTRLSMSEPDMAVNFSVADATAEGWYVTAANPSPSVAQQVRASMNIARKMTFGKMDLSFMGHAITIDGYEQTFDGDPATGAGTFAMKLTNFAISEPTMAAIDPSGTLKQLGYSSLSFDLNGQGKVDVSDTALGLDMSAAIAGREMGTITFGASVAGVPLAAYAEMLAANNPGKQPDFNTLMPQLMQVSFGHVNLRFDDASITKRLLPMAAAMQGMDEAALVANAGAMAQLGLMQLQNQAFSDQATAAINAFLKDPKSITIAAKPAAPVTVAEVMGLNPAAPGEAIAKLAVSVSAND